MYLSDSFNILPCLFMTYNSFKMSTQSRPWSLDAGQDYCSGHQSLPLDEDLHSLAGWYERQNLLLDEVVSDPYGDGSVADGIYARTESSAGVLW